MNEYFVEDETSFYEIVPGCQPGLEKPGIRQRRTGGIRKNDMEETDCEQRKSQDTAKEKRNRSSRHNEQNCSCLILFYLILILTICQGQ